MVLTTSYSEPQGQRDTARRFFKQALKCRPYNLKSLQIKGEPKKKFLFENTRIVLLFLEIFHNFSPYLTNSIPTSKLRTLYLPSDFQKVTDFQRYMRLFQNILLRFGIKQSVTELISDVLSKIRVSELSFCKEQMQSLYSPQKNVTDRLLDFQNPF